mgnify:CR=1 FL=1
MRDFELFLRRSSEIGTDIEITAEGGIVARIPGQEMEKAGSAMLARTSKTNQKLFIAMLK